MSAAIKERLIELNEKVKMLEAAAARTGATVEALKKAPAPAKSGVKQADLFTVFTGGQQRDAMKSMASRLDSTIEKVEELLRQN